MDKGKLIDSAFVDLQKAFGTVDQNRLIEKINCIGVCDEHLNWFKDYLIDRSHTVVFDNCKSKKFPVQYGVPQGSILGSLLFLT